MLNIVVCFLKFEIEIFGKIKRKRKVYKIASQIMSQLLYLITLYHDEPMCTTSMYYMYDFHR